LLGNKEKTPKLHKSPETLKKEQEKRERKAQIKTMTPEAREKFFARQKFFDKKGKSY